MQNYQAAIRKEIFSQKPIITSVNHNQKLNKYGADVSKYTDTIKASLSLSNSTYTGTITPSEK
jgi:hypothetical protein